MTRNETNEPNRLISSAIGVVLPKDNNNYGYLSEHHTFGETGKVSGDYAEDLAATMLATTLGIPFNTDQAWDERKQAYIASGHIFRQLMFASQAKEIKKAYGRQRLPPQYLS